MRMAGKTGTSQVLNRVVRNSDVPWEERDHALFVNFAPFEAPRVAVSIVVEHGGGGSSTAAPIARDITLQALYKGTPPLDAYPASDRGRIQAQQERLERERRARAEEEGRRRGAKVGEGGGLEGELRCGPGMMVASFEQFDGIWRGSSVKTLVQAVAPRRGQRRSLPPLWPLHRQGECVRAARPPERRRLGELPRE